MIKGFDNFRVYALPGIYLLLAVTILAAGDYTVRTAIDNIRTIRLKNYSVNGLEHIRTEIASLESEVSAIEKRVMEESARTYPRLKDIKDLSRNYHLKLEEMEWVIKSSETPGAPKRYNTTFHGSVGNLVKFLRKLETEYILSSQTVSLFPVDEGGKVVGLYISLLVDENK